jgi:hypothetical protein
MTIIITEEIIEDDNEKGPNLRIPAIVNQKKKIQ